VIFRGIERLPRRARQGWWDFITYSKGSTAFVGRKGTPKKITGIQTVDGCGAGCCGKPVYVEVAADFQELVPKVRRKHRRKAGTIQLYG